jgi:uncharacterized membrane protein YdjX (TVP38/TMEM64 family)
VRRLSEVFCRRRGTWQIDLVLRGAAVLTLLAGCAIVRWPATAPMIGFFLVTLFVNGPLGLFLPAAYEPVLILMGRIYSPMLVAAVGIAGILAVDWLDYYLYRAMLHHPLLAPTRRSWVMRQAVSLFDRAPFFAVWLCALGILPHVVVRLLAPLSGYSVRRYLLATFLGRAPRLWLFAALGMMAPVSSEVLLLFTAAMVILPLAILAGRRVARRQPPIPVSPAGAASL